MWMVLAAGFSALVLGGIFGWLLGKRESSAALAASETARTAEQNAAAERQQLLENQFNQQLAAQKEAAEARLKEVKDASDAALQTSEINRQREQSAEADRQKLLEEQFKKQLEAQAKTAQAQYDQLKEEFKTLAEKILSDKSEKLQTSSKTQLDAVLAPFRVKLEEFGKTVQNNHSQAVENNIKLSEQIKALVASSLKLGGEADNLAKALRGNNKLQGNWGEMILDDLLVSAGLSEGQHYLRQATIRDDDGKAVHNTESDRKMCPDVMVTYPDGKVVIIDSKVSLSAYVDYVNAEDDAARDEALKRHIKSVEDHVKELADKDYPGHVRKSKQTPVDFVLMFMPNESAHELAMHNAPSLWSKAFERNVLIVSPVNLMALLQLIQIGWKRYEQDRNQLDILKNATQLLDRLYAFYKEFDNLGDRLESAGKAYADAVHRLKGDGSRSVVSKGEQLKKLGVRLSRKLELPGRLQMEDVSEAGLMTITELPEAGDDAAPLPEDSPELPADADEKAE